MRLFKEFYEIGKFIRNLNTTFNVMVPKKMELRTSLLVW